MIHTIMRLYATLIRATFVSSLTPINTIIMRNAIQEVKRTGLELLVFLIICVTIIFAVLFSSLSRYERATAIEEVATTQSSASYDPLAQEREAAQKRNFGRK